MQLRKVNTKPSIPTTVIYLLVIIYMNKMPFTKNKEKNQNDPSLCFTIILL